MRKALVVGINNYPGNAKLNGCINDASAFSTIIETNGDGSPNFDVRFETNIDSKGKLKSLITTLFKGESEVSLFYFSGHGLVNEHGAYIVTPDFKQYDEGVSMDEILRIANDSPAANKIIILDCCFSGAFGSPNLLGDGAAYIKKGVTVLAASRDNEVSIEVNGHGVFTSLLIDALQGGAADLSGKITPGSVYTYIDKALSWWKQRPVFKTNIIQFVPLRLVNPPVPLAELRKLTEYFPSATSLFKLDPTYEYTTDVAVEKNVIAFKCLQKLQGIGLVIPDNEEYMYWAAINSKACKLTALGYHYWMLVKNKRI